MYAMLGISDFKTQKYCFVNYEYAISYERIYGNDKNHIQDDVYFLVCAVLILILKNLKHIRQNVKVC